MWVRGGNAVHSTAPLEGRGVPGCPLRKRRIGCFSSIAVTLSKDGESSAAFPSASGLPGVRSRGRYFLEFPSVQALNLRMRCLERS